MQIAFIGLGNMGSGMAANLIKAGREVRAFDLSEAALEAAAKKSELMGWQRDVWLYRMAISVLGTLALTAAIGSIVLVSLGKTTPESLIALGSASVGALVGLFAPSPNAK